LGAYLFLGIVRLGLTRRRAGLLVFAPWVTIQLVWATLLGGMGLDRGVWNRSPRAGELVEGTPK